MESEPNRTGHNKLKFNRPRPAPARFRRLRLCSVCRCATVGGLGHHHADMSNRSLYMNRINREEEETDEPAACTVHGR
eukprot:scaffold52279_cov371-Isochrysis_galbana.AAC.3